MPDEENVAQTICFGELIIMISNKFFFLYISIFSDCAPDFYFMHVHMIIDFSMPSKNVNNMHTFCSEISLTAMLIYEQSSYVMHKTHDFLQQFQKKV